MRLKDYDYSLNGAYFITICVEGRQEMLGKIVGDGVLDVPSVQLTEYGQIVKHHIVEISIHYSHIDIDNYVIMPNHIHLLVVVHSGTSRTPSPTNAVIPSFVSTMKRFIHKECGFSLFQRTYYDHIIRSEEEYIKIWKYIDENPAKWTEDCYFTK